MSKSITVVTYDNDGERTGRVEVDAYDCNGEVFVEVFDESHADGTTVTSAVTVLSQESLRELVLALAEVTA